jgi:predicted kinase
MDAIALDTLKYNDCPDKFLLLMPQTWKVNIWSRYIRGANGWMNWGAIPEDIKMQIPPQTKAIAARAFAETLRTLPVNRAYLEGHFNTDWPKDPELLQLLPENIKQKLRQANIPWLNDILGNNQPNPPVPPAREAKKHFNILRAQKIPKKIETNSVITKTSQNQKILILCRGASGSGKSTLAKQLSKGGVSLASDEFFMVDGKYEYDPEAIGYAHNWNKRRAEKAMQQGISPIVIDNTNVQFWEMKPYVELAQKYNYQVKFEEPNTPWKFDAEELAKRNKHGVPKDVIEKMIQKYQKDPSVENVLESEMP